jgi:hypothetical protein
VKHPLVRALRGVGLEHEDVAQRLGVDPKTVKRWFAGRVPYPRHRAALVELTGWAASDLWPDISSPAKGNAPAPEVLAVYPHRSAVPADTWRRFFERAEREIGILAYSGLFLAEDMAILNILRTRARAGVRVRIALGDPDGRNVAQRGTDEGIGAAMPARIHNARVLYGELVTHPMIEVRLHDTVLYNSIFRADDELFVNPHVYGAPASYGLVQHLRHMDDDGMAATYLQSFENVWQTAHTIGGLAIRA